MFMEYSYLYLIVDAALKAGKAILSVYDDPDSDFEVEMKADNSPLTVADRLSNEVICQCLACTPFPILSEEGMHADFAVRSAWSDLWVIDPLDGTKEFIKRNGEFTVNIAWVHNQVPVMGVIYVPVRKELYFAAEGLGAYKLCDISSLSDIGNIDSLIALASRLPFQIERDHYVVVASRSHLSAETKQFIQSVQEEHPNMEMVSSGSSLKICLVAEGKADLYPRFAPTMEWDTAAGHAIARASGCEIYQENSDMPLIYNKENLVNPGFIVEKKR